MPAIHSVRFGLLRHAATLANREKRIQGRTDSPLTGAGHRAALEWGRALAGRGFSMIL
ncbi:MAG: histidine phosphatase family protein, partial [Pseudomonadota bacterium]